MKRVFDFVVENMQPIGLIYAIVAIVVFVVTNIYFWFISSDFEKDLHDEAKYSEGCDDGEAVIGKWIIRVTGMIISVPAALLWWGTPIIVASLVLYDRLQERNPELFGFEKDEFKKEEKK